jgi:hypothetical protein
MKTKTQDSAAAECRNAVDACHRDDGDGIDRIEHLIHALEDCWDEDEDDFEGQLPLSVQQSITGLEGLRHLAAAMTVCRLDLPLYGHTKPVFMSEAIAFMAPDVYARFGEHRVLAMCEEVQYSVIPGQSALFQEKFDDFNRRYFEGRLPDYKILVVYDAWYWSTERCGLREELPPAFDSLGFIDEEGRQIFIRFHTELECGLTMVNTLIHEMAHAATDGDHGNNWQAEMARLKALGAPTSDL